MKNPKIGNMAAIQKEKGIFYSLFVCFICYTCIMCEFQFFLSFICISLKFKTPECNMKNSFLYFHSTNAFQDVSENLKWKEGLHSFLVPLKSYLLFALRGKVSSILGLCLAIDRWTGIMRVHLKNDTILGERTGNKFLDINIGYCCTL